MVDEILDRIQLEGRAELNSAIDSRLASIGRSAMAGFEALQRIQWRAPWQREPQAHSR